MAHLVRNQPLLGTFVEMSLEADCPQEQLVEASELAFGRIREIQSLMSFHDPESELSRVNHHAGFAPVQISPDTLCVLKTALQFSRETDGAYDVTVASQLVRKGFLPNTGCQYSAPNWQAIELANDTVTLHEGVAIDLGGIAKGYAVDVAFDALSSLPIKFRQVIVNAGGDLRMLQWREEPISVRHKSLFGRKQYKQLSMRRSALASSAPGQGSPSSQIVDPQKGSFKKHWRTYAIFATTCMVADAMTKIAGVGAIGKDILKRYDAEALSVDAFGRVGWFAS